MSSKSIKSSQGGTMKSKEIAEKYLLDQKELDSFILGSQLKFMSSFFNGVEVFEEPEIVYQEFIKYKEAKKEAENKQESLTGTENGKESSTETDKSNNPGFFKKKIMEQGDRKVQKELERINLGELNDPETMEKVKQVILRTGSHEYIHAGIQQSLNASQQKSIALLLDTIVEQNWILIYQLDSIASKLKD